MALGEFDLIARYFAKIGAARSDVQVGVGDDGAVLVPPPGHDLVAVVDTLVAGVHFPQGSPASSIGHRAVAVNLSDIAAMGATPSWALLALSLPSVDEDWLAQFAHGTGELLTQHAVSLVGGDTTTGPLTITVQLIGAVPRGQALRRTGARPGDAIVVSGTPGDAAAGLAIEQRRMQCAAPHAAELRQRFLYPTPRCALGVALRGIASACIDLSDGLGADLGKLCAASGRGGELELTTLPISAALAAAVDRDRARQLALTGGDDYELCFTVPPANFARLTQLAQRSATPLTRIGSIVERPGVTLRDGATVTQFSHRGFDHFG
ncbi:MAG TPA: thiamine-phosphate kinase [Steroidobacteraceae bacterium]|nr:thiamine-phosphate kinase [Steroidobacteraceae bacterium]HRX88220.1 thiamine-phosphate kinase [Steroidobacteraceae bacterium]